MHHDEARKDETVNVRETAGQQRQGDPAPQPLTGGSLGGGKTLRMRMWQRAQTLERQLEDVRRDVALLDRHPAIEIAADLNQKY